MDSFAIFPPRLFGSIEYYATMRQYPRVAIDYNIRYNKAEKAVHRFEIADTRGRLSLTIPVSRPSGVCLWSDILVSDHGRWYETMPIALESAYGRTPFFEFYIDRLRPLFEMRQDQRITELCARADSAIRKILDFPTEIVDCPTGSAVSALENIADTARPYWQVRAHTLGFIPNLSILDLIFNLGPEADIYLENIVAPKN